MKPKEIKDFNGKNIKIRKLSKDDLKNVKEFQKFINSLIKENAKINLNKNLSFQEEQKFLEGQLRKIKEHKTVFLVAEDKKRIAGTSEISLGEGRQNHVGIFGITIRKGYRGIGLGTCLMENIIELAKKELKPRPKIIRLSVFSINKPASALYKKLGFLEIAKIPKVIQYGDGFIDEIIMLKKYNYKTTRK
ncbi:MAG: GNAT family N-acetyltransferase [bacterium]|nr:GNAT family N-acetyltransferase [bacterium]